MRRERQRDADTKQNATRATTPSPNRAFDTNDPDYRKPGVVLIRIAFKNAHWLLSDIDTPTEFPHTAPHARFVRQSSSKLGLETQRTPRRRSAHVAAQVRHKCGTSAAQVRHKFGASAEQVRSKCGHQCARWWMFLTSPNDCGLPYIDASSGRADPMKRCLADTRVICYLFMLSVQGFTPSSPI